MGTDILLGLRNLRRRLGRTLLTAIMIGLSTALVVFSTALGEGTYQDMIRIATRTYTGHFQVVAEGYNDKPSIFKTVKEPDKIRAELKAMPEVVAVTARVETAGLLFTDERTEAVLLTGVEPEAERTVTTFPNAVEEGTWLEPPDADHLPIVIGDGLAKRLRVKLGQEVSFLGQTGQGAIAAEVFTVVGVLDSGMDDLDAAMAFIRLPDAQEMLELHHRVHRILGITERVKQVDDLEKRIDAGAGNRFMDWAALMPGLQESIEADRAGAVVFIFIILLVVGLGVTNTMLMTVMERTREIGVLVALGTTPGRVVSVTMWETFWLNALSVGLGTLLGAVFVWAVGDTGIPLGDAAMEFGGVMLDVMVPRNTVRGTLIYPLSIFVCGMLAGLIPAVRAARMSPASALRRA